MAIAYDLSIQDLFENEINWEQHRLNPIDPPELISKGKRPIVEFEAALKDAISKSTTVPPSLKSLCRKYRIPWSTAVRRFPILVRKLVKKYHKYNMKLRTQVQRRRDARLDVLVKELVAKGRDVNCWQLAKLIEERGELDAYSMTTLFRKRFKQQDGDPASQPPVSRPPATEGMK